MALWCGLVIDLKPFERAVAQLGDALALYDGVSSGGDLRLQKHMRAATIQAFGFTYEVTFKMLKRQLGAMASSPATVKGMTFDDIMREAYGRDLVRSDITVWRRYRENRGITGHTYNEDLAREVFGCAGDFLADARYALDRLRRRNGSFDRPG